MHTKFKILTLSAAMLACGLGLSGTAQANAYAVSTNNVEGGLIFAFVNGQVVPPGNPQLNFGTPSSLSSASANLNGSGESKSKGGTNPDSPVTNGDGAVPARTNELVGGPVACSPLAACTTTNYYTLFGQLGTAYSAGDANVISEQQFNPATGELVPARARNIAESNIPAAGLADANGRNGSSSELTVTLDIGEQCNLSTVICQISFSFWADPYMQVALDALAAGTVAEADLTAFARLTRVSDGDTVFAWAPNGVVGNGITGGTENFDAEDLNGSIQLLSGQILPVTYSGPYANGDFGFYQAFTDALLPGKYTLTLAFNEHSNVERREGVPEPASLALLGLGLAGLGLTRRRKQA